MQQSDQQPIVPAPVSGNRSRRVRRVALAVALGGGLALGVAGLAHADGASTAPSAPATAPSAPATAPSAPAGPGGAPDAARVHKPHLDGTVKEIGSGKILIVDREGFTRQINTTSVPDGVKVGTRIHAEGTVNADGVSLDAASVAVAPEHGPGDPAGPGKGGPGGHGRPGAPAPAPGASGAPAAPAPGASGAPAAPAPAESGAPAPSATS